MTRAQAVAPQEAGERWLRPSGGRTALPRTVSGQPQGHPGQASRSQLQLRVETPLDRLDQGS